MKRIQYTNDVELERIKKDLTLFSKNDDDNEPHLLYRVPEEEDEEEGDKNVVIVPRLYKGFDVGKSKLKKNKNDPKWPLPPWSQNFILKRVVGPDGMQKTDQVRAVKEMVEALDTCGGLTCVIGCGKGKTVMALNVIKEKEKEVKKVVILCTKELLIAQWIERIGQVYEWESEEQFKESVCVVQQKKREVEGSRFVIGSVPTLYRHPELTLKADLIIWDEAHHCPARSFRTVLQNNFEYDVPYTIALTATPKRRDGLEKIMYLSMGKPLEAGLIEEKKLHPLFRGQKKAKAKTENTPKKSNKRKGKVKVPQVNVIHVNETVHRSTVCRRPKPKVKETGKKRKRDGSYSRGITTISKDMARNKLIVAVVIRFMKSTKESPRKGLILSHRVEQLHTLKSLIEAQIEATLGKKCKDGDVRVLTGPIAKKIRQKEESRRKRRAKKAAKEGIELVDDGVNLSDLMFGRFLTLSTYSFFGEAIDFDGDYLLLSTPVSTGSIEQCAGRILRGHSQNQPLIIDFEDNGIKSLPEFAGMSIGRRKFYKKMGFQVIYLTDSARYFPTK